MKYLLALSLVLLIVTGMCTRAWVTYNMCLNKGQLGKLDSDFVMCHNEAVNAFPEVLR